MFQMKFIDGTPVDKAYADTVSKMVRSAADAEDKIPLDELENFAELNRHNLVKKDLTEQAAA